MNFDLNLHLTNYRFVRINFDDPKRNFERIRAAYLEKQLNFDENEKVEKCVKKLRNGSLLVKTKENQVKQFLLISMEDMNGYDAN